MPNEVEFIPDTTEYIGGERPCSMSEPNIRITIPRYLCKDYLGIMALDVLHDAKGHGYLAGHKLAQVTDLLAEAILISNEDLEDPQLVRDYVFESVLKYFLELWTDNISALGLHAVPSPDSTIEQLREIVTLPFRNVAGRDDEDAFISLGKNKHGVEAQNYHDQRNKLYHHHAETMAFISPKGIEKPADYFRQAAGIVDIINARTQQQAKVVLDMKASAGLIRTLTDPLGYITGLPTYADPGYNMPGMSAIRQHAEIEFVNSQGNNSYSGPKEFRYCVQLDTLFSNKPLILIDTTYFYGVAKDGLDRNNVMVQILNDQFHNKLPRSMMMAEALGKYLKPSTEEVSTTIGYALETLSHIIWDYYKQVVPPITFLQQIENGYTELYTQGQLSLDTFTTLTNRTMAQTVCEWCAEENTIFRTSYILMTLKHLHLYQIRLPDDNCEILLPYEMITKMLPDLMYEYITTDPKYVSDTLLAFSYHQYTLLSQFIGKPGTPGVMYYSGLSALLNNQWLPKRKGKLVTQINKQVLEWRKTQINTLTMVHGSIGIYFNKLIHYCSQQLGVLIDIQHDDKDPRIIDFLQHIPDFQPTILLEQTLTKYLHFYQPEMYYQSSTIEHKGLLLAVLLDLITCKKPLLEAPIDLTTIINAVVHPTRAEYRHDYKKMDALQMVLGKFSGDFGQIMWCICNGHIFASEDNNTSAMALMLHRLPKEFIQTKLPSGTWGNIHGLGDGSCVDVTLDK